MEPDGAPVAPPDLICKSCGTAFPASGKWGPFGFQVTPCSECGRRSWGPLNRAARVSFWVILVLTVIGMLLGLATAYFTIPALGGVIAAVLLIVDASIRKRTSTVVVTTATLASVLTAGMLFGLLALGMGNGYTTTVIDRPVETVIEHLGTSLESGGQICGDGEDYSACLNMHIAMYNSVCLSTDLDPSASSTCSSLSSFIEDVRVRSANCGYGCTTNAGDDGRWGWAYLTPSPVTNVKRIDAVSHEEVCWFQLAYLAIGECR